MINLNSKSNLEKGKFMVEVGEKTELKGKNI